MPDYVFYRGDKKVAEMKGVPLKVAHSYALKQRTKFTIWGTPAQVAKWKATWGRPEWKRNWAKRHGIKP